MDSLHLLGIEIGGTKLQVGLGRGDGRLTGLERRQVEPNRGAEAIRAQIVEATRALLSRTGVSIADIAAIGIGFGGPVDSAKGVVTVSNQIEGWTGFPIGEWASQGLGIPRVAIQNDADTAALGEARYGAGIGVSPVLYVTIGSGIGGGLVVDGNIYRGLGLGAIEIGHLIIRDAADFEAEGRPAHPATLEQLASGWSIGRRGADVVLRSLGRGHPSQKNPLVRLCEGDPARVTAVTVAEAAAEGDEAAIEVLDTARLAMGRALAHAITLLAPRRIILGGGVSMIGEEGWFEPIRREAERRVFPPFRGTYDIKAATLGEEVVVHGALALALDLAMGQ